MPSWQSSFFDRYLRMAKPQAVEADTDIAELRRLYTYLSDRFGAVPRDGMFEPVSLGPVKGEWVKTKISQPTRLILFFHGGGYIAGSPETHRALIAKLAHASEATAFSLAYRLAPEFAFPAAVRDGLDAYRQLLSRGHAPGSIVVAGNGSGGGLAFSVLLAIRNSKLPMPAGCLAMSPWADMTLSGLSILQNVSKDTALSWELLFVSARHYLKKVPPADPYASPVFGNFKDFPPVMVHAGSLEMLRDDASRLGDRAAEAGVSVSVEIYDGMQHCFQAMSHVPEAKVSLQRLGQFVRQRTAARIESVPAAGR